MALVGESGFKRRLAEGIAVGEQFLSRPIMVAVGAAGADAGKRVYHEDSFFGGIAVSSYRFG